MKYSRQDWGNISLIRCIQTSILYSFMPEFMWYFSGITIARFPFAIYYSVNEQEVWIYAVLDCR